MQTQGLDLISRGSKPQSSLGQLATTNQKRSECRGRLWHYFFFSLAESHLPPFFPLQDPIIHQSIPKYCPLLRPTIPDFFYLLRKKSRIFLLSYFLVPHFMQPEHTQAFQDTAPSTESLPASRISTAQHGIHNLSTALHSLSDLSRGADAGGIRGIGDEHGSSDGAGNSGMSCDSNGRGDTTPHKDDGDIISPPKQKKDAISQYEARGASPPLCDTGFHVKKTNWQGRLDSPISRFPSGIASILFEQRNGLIVDLSAEVLIHSLSFLDPQTLLTASLVSRRFHSLIASPDVWRSAFSRYFPSASLDQVSSDIRESVAFSSSQDRRFFTRLSAGGSGSDPWRREYILRTRLLRDLARGKPHSSASRSSPKSKNSQGSVIITYNALTGPISVGHLAAGFSSKGVRLLHASVDTIVITASDATAGRDTRMFDIHWRRC